jgi:alkanesulfonate monooxygenase SsuD/methylene tetrahydromethanopterin reductase-like flavin-dependent oxidoreductase (luciferase family)
VTTACIISFSCASVLAYLTKNERYTRTREYMAIVKQAWTSREPFDHDRPHYRFADFVSDIFPVQQPRPRVSFGGSSPAAYQPAARRPTATACGASRSRTQPGRSNR